MSDIIQIWLSQCNKCSAAYTLLEKHQYRHDWLKHGDLGGVYARITGRYFEPDEDGDFYITQAVWYDQPSAHNEVEDPMLFDIIAWQPEAPRRWYFYRGEAGLILGERAMFEAALFKEPLTMYSTPLAWLRAGCRGCVLLDHHGLNRLYGLKELICEDVAHGTRIEQGLSLYYRKNMPRLSVSVGGAA